METGPEGNVAGNSSENYQLMVTASREGKMDMSNQVGSEHTSQELDATVSAMDPTASLVSTTVSPSMEAMVNAPSVEARHSGFAPSDCPIWTDFWGENF